MKLLSRGRTRRSRSWIGACLLLFAGYVLGRITPPPSLVDAQTRSTPPREAFLSGGERAEAVLKEMQVTLEKIDGRVERIERLLSGQGPPPVNPTP